MAELVTLPSGAVAPLEAPPLERLCAFGGSLEGLARTAFAHDDVDVSDLAEDDVYAVAAWAVAAFIDTPDAATLGRLAIAYGEPPRKRLGVRDRLLGLALDAGCLQALESDARADDTTDDEEGGRLVITSPG